MNLQEVADRLEIEQQLANYANGVDGSDWDLYRSVFTADADIDYTQSTPLRGTPDQIVAVFEPAFAGMPYTQHYITNISYRFDGDVCHVKAMFYNPCQLSFMNGLSYYHGYYEHEFVRTVEGWKSRRLVEVPRWTVNAPSAEQRPSLPQVGLVEG